MVSNGKSATPNFDVKYEKHDIQSIPQTTNCFFGDIFRNTLACHKTPAVFPFNISSIKLNTYVRSAYISCRKF